MLVGAPQNRFDEDNDDGDNARVMEMAMMVMTTLGLFPDLMLNEDEKCNANHLC